MEKIGRSGGGFRLRSVLQQFSSAYWKFFAAAFCMDLGFGLFIFLFNLYLTDLHHDERFIGRVIACFTFGNVAGTLPAMSFARKKGLRGLLIFTFICTPILAALRVVFTWWPAQMVLAFGSGAALCGWPICFSPTVAAVTDEDNRSLGFSMAFATGIGLGAFAGVCGGYVPEILHRSALHLSVIDGMRAVLLGACALTMAGIFPILNLQLKQQSAVRGEKIRIFHPFLLQFLPAFVLWNVVTGSFPAFGAIYLQKSLGIPLGKLGTIFSLSQLAQFCAVLISPAILRSFGIPGGIASMQACTALLLCLLAGARSAPVAICLYLLYFATQFMCGPGIYSLLMSKIPEKERSTASAMQNLSGALCQAATAALTGVGIVAFGYSSILLVNAAIAVGAALLFYRMRSHTTIRDPDREEVIVWHEECHRVDLQSAEGTR